MTRTRLGAITQIYRKRIRKITPGIIMAVPEEPVVVVVVKLYGLADEEEEEEEALLAAAPAAMRAIAMMKKAPLHSIAIAARYLFHDGPVDQYTG